MRSALASNSDCSYQYGRMLVITEAFLPAYAAQLETSAMSRPQGACSAPDPFPCANRQYPEATADCRMSCCPITPLPRSPPATSALAQQGVIVTLATRPFWADTAITWLAGTPKTAAEVSRCSICDATRSCAERIPQRVDLLPTTSRAVRGTWPRGPDGHDSVRAGDTRIGTQDAATAMCLRQQAHRELRLGNERIQARCVQDNQAASAKGVRC